MSRLIRLLAMTLLLAALGGCGFHLQGVSHLPVAFSTTTIAAEDRYTDFNRALSDALRVSGSTLVSVGATATVEVISDEHGQRVLSVSANNAPTEYEVWYTVRYRVLVGAREALSPQVLTLSRDYSFDATAVLPKEHEQEMIRAALARELAALVMRRLTALPP
ncbi:MAG: LPS assembly lipoprotein LptE [Pseudomonadota bacterium]